MSSTQSQNPVDNDFYLVAHVATTCDEHGVYVTKDSAEVIELGWLLLDLKSLEEVGNLPLYIFIHISGLHMLLQIDTPGKHPGQAYQYTHHPTLQYVLKPFRQSPL